MFDEIRRGIARRTAAMQSAMGDSKPKAKIPEAKMAAKAVKPRTAIDNPAAGMQAINGVTVVNPPRDSNMAYSALTQARRAGVVRKPWYLR
jgi:hypothetical protein